MDQVWLYLIFLSGLLSLTLSKPQEYILIKQGMNWSDAQKYCRTNHIDLPTVQTDEDWRSLQEAADEQSFSSFVWIGLYNDINSWRWSYNDESLVFKSWGTGQPDNSNGNDECIAIYYTGFYYDFPCASLYNFICYDGGANATQRMVLIKTSQTWSDAQKYCRGHYTDLAVIRSQQDITEMTTVVSGAGYYFWIGLYRDNWKWSDQANLTFSPKLTVHSFGVQNRDCTGTYTDNPSPWACPCSGVYYFCCHTVKRSRQVIRVQVKAAESVNDAKLETLVFNKLKQTVSDEDVTVTWRTQPNGNVFQKSQTVQKPANTTACSSVQKH